MPDVPSDAGVSLSAIDLNSWYGESHVLHGISLSIKEGELVTLLGRNGAGKTTTLRSIMGLVDHVKGAIRLNGKDILGWAPERIAGAGIAYCPEERGIYASLTVEENLLLPRVVRPGGATLEQIFRSFPPLEERRRSQGSKLSGGEQQMLAIARILRTGARLLLLDEPTEGLAPVIVQEIERLIAELKTQGYTILLVEQNIRFATAVGDRHYVIENGQVIDHLENAQLSDRAILEGYLGV